MSRLRPAARSDALIRGRTSKKGPGFATVYYGDIDPDFDGGVPFGVQSLFLKPLQSAPAPDEWGTIAAWTWGASRRCSGLRLARK